MAKGTVLEHVHVNNWINFLDVMIMWLQEYSKLVMIRESGLAFHGHLEKWLGILQAKAVEYVSHNLSFADFYRLHKASENRRRAAARRQGRRFLARKLKIVVDESFLNRTKLTRLAPNVRPQTDKIWLWGATIAGHPEMFLFKILEHPDDAFDGRPRGCKELKACFDLLPLKRDMIVVSDGWRGTLAAINQIKAREGWGARDLRHEVVVHSRGEVVNERGYTTNPIENRWSVIKRWLKKKYGGALPPLRSRGAWKKVVEEFRYRKMASRGHSNDYNHTFFVPTKVFCQHLSTLL